MPPSPRLFPGLSWFILLVLSLPSLLLHLQLKDEARRRWQAEIDVTAERVFSALNRSQNGLMLPVQGLQQLFSHSEEVTAEEFERASRELTQPGYFQPFLGCALVAKDGQGQARILYSTSAHPLFKTLGPLPASPVLARLLDRLEQSQGQILGSEPFDEPTGHALAALGATVGNARQSGQVLCLVDYSLLLNELGTEWLSDDTALELASEPWRYRVNTLPVVAGFHETRLHSAGRQWHYRLDVGPGFRGGPDLALAWTLLIAGLLIAGLLALVTRLVAELRQTQWLQAELAARLAARDAAGPK
ncbi:MAG: hypothetical protein HYV16_03085 [Gammaproteobacteria bacterium]|nr:hypothetical protein [Gammaproteobacteria bacterium]